jgi:superoxide reductase
MQRREFIKVATAGSVAGVIAPQWVMAEEVSLPELMGAGGLFYTKDNPGRWAKKVGGHLPYLTVESKTDGKVTLKVETDHVMMAYKHYIVKHTLLDAEFQFLDDHLFNPETEEEPISMHTLEYTGTVYVVSHCNKHDAWLNVFKV